MSAPALARIHTSLFYIFKYPILIKFNLGHPLVWVNFRHLQLRCGLFCDYFEANTVAVSHYLFFCQFCYDMNEEVVRFIPVLCGATVRWAFFFLCQHWLIILKAGEETHSYYQMVVDAGGTNMIIFVSFFSYWFLLLLSFFQYLVELVPKEMRVSDKVVSVSTLELWK